MIHAEVTAAEQAARLAMRELIDAYAHRLDPNAAFSSLTREAMR
jgi:hypothetical protein